MNNNTEYTGTAVYSEERVPIRSVKSWIDAVAFPLSATERLHLEGLIQHESAGLASAFRRQEQEGLEATRASRDGALERREQARTDLAEAEERKREVQREMEPSWAKAVISTLCAVACFAAEFALTWQALTFVLNVPRYSILGILLGLAPPSALAILELVVLRLFEAPWRRLCSVAVQSFWRRAVTVAAMIVLLAGLAAGNLYTVLLLAEAREESTRAQHNLMREDGEEAVEIDHAVINRAIVAVSICVTVDGALFLLLALEEGRGIRARRRWRLVVERLREAHEAAAKAVHEAEGRVRGIEQALADLESRSQTLAERFRHQCLFELEQRLHKIRRELPTEQLVQFGLRERSAGSAA